MENLQGSPAARAQLNEWMNERRQQLRLRWSQVAELAGMGTPNLLRIRKGQISISWDAADGIEDALEWERGSVRAAVDLGQKPQPRDAVTRTGPGALTDEEQQRFLMARDFMRTQGRELTVRMWQSMRDEYLRLEEAAEAAEPDRSR
jgi:hypothetical protein